MKPEPIISFKVAVHPLSVSALETEERLIVATSLISGDSQINILDQSANIILDKKIYHLHRESIRKICIDGGKIYTASSDKSMRVHTLEGQNIYCGEMKAPVYSMLVIDNFTILGGDDEGSVSLFDSRQGENPSFTVGDQVDYISDMKMDKIKTHIVYCTSGDGTLAEYDIRKNDKKLRTISSSQDSEPVCLLVEKNSRGECQLLTGSDRGVISVWSRDHISGKNFVVNEKISQLKSVTSIDKMVSLEARVSEYASDAPTRDSGIDSDGLIDTLGSSISTRENGIEKCHVILLGGDDGMIRAMNIFPTDKVSVVGMHQKDVAIEEIWSGSDFFISCGADERVNVWSTQICLQDGLYDNLMSKRKRLTKQKFNENSDFFSHL